VPIERIEVGAFTVATESPESDGTFAWNNTTVVVVEAFAEHERGIGYTYASTAAARLISEVLIEQVRGMDAMAVSWCLGSRTLSIRKNEGGSQCGTRPRARQRSSHGAHRCLGTAGLQVSPVGKSTRSGTHEFFPHESSFGNCTAAAFAEIGLRVVSDMVSNTNDSAFRP